MTRATGFYFANLGADVERCLRAADDGDEKRYADSLSRAYRTLNYLRSRPEAYEEGLLLLRGLAFAKNEAGSRRVFGRLLDGLISPMSLTNH